MHLSLARLASGARAAALALGLATAPCALGGCAITDYTAGQDLRPESVENLEVGASSQADVLVELGPPDDLAELTYGSIWVYRLTEGAINTLEIQVYNATAGVERAEGRYGALAIIFDRKGRLSAIGITSP